MHNMMAKYGINAVKYATTEISRLQLVTEFRSFHISKPMLSYHKIIDPKKNYHDVLMTLMSVYRLINLFSDSKVATRFKQLECWRCLRKWPPCFGSSKTCVNEVRIANTKEPKKIKNGHLGRLDYLYLREYWYTTAKFNLLTKI